MVEARGLRVEVAGSAVQCVGFLAGRVFIEMGFISTGAIRFTVRAEAACLALKPAARS
jgi:hypothetical protein